MHARDRALRLFGGVLALAATCWLVVGVAFVGFLVIPMCDTGAGCQRAPPVYTLVQTALSLAGASAGFVAARGLWSRSKISSARLAAALVLVFACGSLWTLLLLIEAAD